MKKVLLAVVAILVAVAIGIGCGYLIFEKDVFHKSGNDLSVVAVRAAFDPDAVRLQEYMGNDAIRPVLTGSYGMSDEMANEFYETVAEWLSYNLIVEIANESEEEINVCGFQVKDNGKDGVYLSTDFGSALGISAGGKGAATIGVLCRNGELSDDAVKALVNQMEISVLYSKTPTENFDGTESVEETHAAVIGTRAGF